MAKAKAKESNALTSVQQRIQSRLAKINETTAAPSGQNISVKGSMFKLPNGQTSPGPLNCIILDYCNKNMFYTKPYQEGDFEEPECYAVGREIKTMAPTIEDPVSATCDTCPNNKFGSKGRGKACSNNVLLAILPEDFTEDSDVFTIKASATAIKSWTNYVRELSSVNVDPIQVVTSLSFETGLAYPSLRFKQIGSNKKLEEVNQFLQRAETLLDVG